jgi:hypothetical protein
MKPQVSAWISAAQILLEDARREVACPGCGAGILRVEIVTIGTPPECEERFLRCDKCGRFEITMRRFATAK